MPLDGNGGYSLPSPEFPAVSGTDILASDFNTILGDIRNVLNYALYRDGQVDLAIDFSLNSHKLVSMADGTEADDGCTKGQLDTAIAAIPGMPEVIPTVVCGMITAWIGGYFTNGTNGGFTSVLGNTVTVANALLNDDGWYVCNGAELNLSTSPIFNGAGRYLPNLTDARFLQGDLTAGVSGGESTLTVTVPSHTHSFSQSGNTEYYTLTTDHIPAHTHAASGGSVYVGSGSPPNADVDITGGSYKQNTFVSVGGGNGHRHGMSVSGTTGSGSSTGVDYENRPKFLSTLMIMRVL